MLITLGIGPGSSISELVLFGLGGATGGVVNAAVIEAIGSKSSPTINGTGSWNPVISVVGV